MRAKRGLRIGTILLSFGLLWACGPKKQTNEGFPVGLSELNDEDYEDSFWKLVREALSIPKIEGDSVDQLLASLFVLPSYLTDTEEAPTEVATQTATLLATAEQTVCAEVKAPLVDLNPGSAIGSVDAFAVTNGVPSSLEPLGAKVYLMNYKLKGDTDYRQALITVPKVAAATAHATSSQLGVQAETSGGYGYPILMYGHAGASGLSYTEIASSLGALQRAFIVAAPIFPGEPLCKTYDTGTTTCTGSNIASAAVGISEPYENDVIDYLGLHDCMKTFAGGAAKAYVNPTTGAAGTEDLAAKIVKINAQASTALASVSPLASAAASAPVSIAAGLGRGAAVAGLALARAGAYNSLFAGSDTAAITALAGKGVKPPMFSCSLLASPQASFISGSNRLLLESWVREGSNVLGASERAAAEFIPGFASIHAKIKAIRENAALSDEEKVAQIKAYAQKIDLVNATALMQVGVQNFGKIFTSQVLAATDATLSNTTKAKAQGSILLIHGTQDQVANVGNSALLSTYGIATSEVLLSQGLTAGTNWLALGITPPEASVDELGDLPATDLDHVDSASFTNGQSANAGGLESNITGEEDYIGLTPPALISSWALTQCMASMNANSGT